MISVRARDLPGLRARTVLGLRAHAQILRERAADPDRADLYRDMSGGNDPAQVAADTDRLATRLRGSELWHVTADMTDVALDASRTLPAWTPSAACPCDRGLLTWEGGLPPLPWQGAPDAAWTTGPLGVPHPPLVPVDGVAWAVVGDRLEVSILVLADRVMPYLAGPLRDQPLFAFGRVAAAATSEPVPGVGMGAPVGAPGDLGALLAALGATWLLMGQEGIAETTALFPDAKTSAAARRAGRPDPIVTVVTLRRAHHDRQPGTEPSGRHLIHRHVVRGHWRQQPHGPEHALRRPTWIAPHVKGPDGAPFVRSEVVRVWRR